MLAAIHNGIAIIPAINSLAPCIRECGATASLALGRGGCVQYNTYLLNRNLLYLPTYYVPCMSSMLRMFVNV